jgi:hypothetical protein
VSDVQRRLAAMHTADRTDTPATTVTVSLAFPQRQNGTMTAEEFEAHERVLRQLRGLATAYDKWLKVHKQRQR